MHPNSATKLLPKWQFHVSGHILRELQISSDFLYNEYDLFRNELLL